MSETAVELAAPAATAQVLTFVLGEELFALDIAHVREIIQAGAATPMPLMPAFVHGVINLRGAVVPVIDLAARLGRGAVRSGRKRCVVVYDASRDGERAEIGLLVDAVNEVVDLAANEIEAPPSFGASVPREFIRGIGRRHGRFMTLLEPARAFDLDDMVQACATAAPRLQAA